MDKLLFGGIVVNEGHKKEACIWIKDDKIGGIFDSVEQALNKEDISSSIEKINISGCFLIPGVIDDQVHFREPGLTYKGDIYSESRAAVAGGVTSYMEMPNTKPATLTQALLQDKYDRASEVSLANYSFYMGCSEDNLKEVLKTDPNTVCGIKIFLGSSTGNMLVKSEDYIENLFKNSPVLVAAHCEDEDIMARNTTEVKTIYGDNPPFSVHPRIRSQEACYASSSKAVSLARKAGGRLHVLHLSTAKELELLDNSPLEDARITGEVCVHHLWFTDSDYEHKHGFIKWNPAIKTASDRAALRQAVKEGRVIVATDHAPHSLEEKQNNYFSCPSGGPLVQHSLRIMLEMVELKVFTIEEVVDSMCHRPARLFSVLERGFIREGYKADIVVFKLNEEPHTEPIIYKCGWSPFFEKTFNSRIEYTFVNGKKVYEKGQIIEGKAGERLLFSRKG